MENLKSKFRRGLYPTEEDFSSLIDAISRNETLISSESKRATTAESTLSTSIAEKTEQVNKTLRNMMVKRNVTSNETFNNIVRELYFDRWFDVKQIKRIGFSRKDESQGAPNPVWQMYFVDNNNNWSYANFSTSSVIEKDDVCVATINVTDNSHLLYGKDIKVYAVIYWELLSEGTQSIYSDVDLRYETTILKFHPIISNCIANHKYAHTHRALQAIKELYIEDFKKNGTPVTAKDFEKYFNVVSIACNYIEGVKRNYQIAIQDVREKDKDEYIYILQATPITMKIRCFILTKLPILPDHSLEALQQGIHIVIRYMPLLIGV